MSIAVAPWSAVLLCCAFCSISSFSRAAICLHSLRRLSAVSIALWSESATHTSGVVGETPMARKN